SFYGVYAQRYTAAGTPLGGEFQVNTSTSLYQRQPAVAADADGDFVVAWQDGAAFVNGQDGSLYGVYAQRYADLDDNGDTAGPAVAAVLPGGVSAPIRGGDRLAAPIPGLVVAFTEAMATTGTGSVTSLANWRLARGGADVSSRIT